MKIHSTQHGALLPYLVYLILLLIALHTVQAGVQCLYNIMLVLLSPLPFLSKVPWRLFHYAPHTANKQGGKVYFHGIVQIMYTGFSLWILKSSGTWIYNMKNLEGILLLQSNCVFLFIIYQQQFSPGYNSSHILLLIQVVQPWCK